MKIAICDSNEVDLVRLKQIIHGYASEYNVSCKIDLYDNENLLLSSGSYHCYFFAITKSSKSGFATIRKLRDKDHNSLFIFVSEQVIFAIDALNNGCFRYILKPYEFIRVYQVMDAVFRRFDLCVVYIEDILNRQHKIFITDILYIEVLFKHTEIHLNSYIIESKRTIAQWYENFDKTKFVHCDRGVLINITQIDFIINDEIYIKNGEKKYSKK